MSEPGPRSCASCDETGCAMQRLHGMAGAMTERTTWLLDERWPETASMVAALFRPGDQLLAPGVFGARPARYRWPVAAEHRAALATIRRHAAMRWVASAPGGVRQRTYLDHDRAIALRLARAIDYRARHLVVAQTWLPWLDNAGALGGRSFDVVMHRHPLGEIHRILDAAAAEIAGLGSIADFRAEASLVACEAALLARARRVITPHPGIAALFGERAMRLSWHRPPPLPRRPGGRVAFLGPTIARERPDLVRALAGDLTEPLIVFGSMIEPGTWDGFPIERRTFGPGWLDDIGTILHPAVLTTQPRRLLEAIASGVSVHATSGSGLDPEDYLPIEQFSCADEDRCDIGAAGIRDEDGQVSWA